MTAIRPERLGGERTVPERTGPEAFAPNRRFPERQTEPEQTAAAVEGEIREFVRRDVAFLRRSRADAEQPAAEPMVDSLNVLIRRVSGASMEEIDRVILTLQSVREMLRIEGERVGREIAGYASLSHAAMTAMKVIGDSLAQWKNPPGNNSDRRPPG